MKKLFWAVVLMVFGAMSWGCGSSKQVTVEPESTTAESMETRSEPSDTDDGGLVSDPGDVERLPVIDFERIHFDTDKWSVREDARDILKRNAELLAANPGVRIMVEGHCDERNTVEYNLALGERRASSTQKYLVKLGVDPARITTISYGEERPMSFGHDENAWWQNRRAEVMVTE